MLASLAKYGTPMIWRDIEQNWTGLRSDAMLQWGELTDDDLCRINGDELQLIGRIQLRYAVARAEAERQVAEWADALGPRN
jgi:uncharacterized protein YjbJ (UPF0337 family)